MSEETKKTIILNEKELKEFLNTKLTFSKDEQEKFWNIFTGSYASLIRRGMTDFEAKAFILATFYDLDIPLKIIGSENKAYGYLYLDAEGKTHHVFRLKERITNFYDNIEGHLFRHVNKYFDAPEDYLFDEYAYEGYKRGKYTYHRSEDFHDKMVKRDYPIKIARGIEAMRKMNLLVYQEYMANKNLDDLGKEKTKSLLEKETEKLIEDIGVVADYLGKTEVANFVVESLLNKYKTMSNESEKTGDIELRVIPTDYALVLQTLFLELRKFYLKLEQEQKEKLELQANKNPIDNLDTKYNGEDIVNNSIEEILTMSEEIGIRDEAKFKTDFLKKEIKNKPTAESMMKLFDYLQEVKSEYDLLLKKEEREKGFDGLSELNEGNMQKK